MDTTIHAQVSPSILNKADRLFSNRLSTIFVELLQNARRAGATLVTVKTTARDGHSRIRVRDNGEGIKDFSTLLSLGASDWSEETALKEDPAGMGFFSLIHSGVTVRSNGHEATITKQSFLGLESVTVKEQAKPSPQNGTELVFERPEPLDEIEVALRRVALHGPVDVTLNRKKLMRENFLAGAIALKLFDGVRIGVFPAYGRRDFARMNFYGNEVAASSNDFFLEDVCIGNERGGSLTVRFDVLSTSKLRLKLPDHAAVVEDEAFAELKKQARIVMYSALRVMPEGHTASFVQFKEARSLGVTLPPPTLLLRRFVVPNDNDESFVGDFDSCPKAFDPSRAAIVEVVNDRINPYAFTFERALPNHALPEGRAVMLPEPRFAGYPAYDGIPRLKNFTLVIDGKPYGLAAKEAEATLRLVNSIQLSFEYAGSTQQWDLDFAGWADEGGYDDATLLITRNSPWMRDGQEDRPFYLTDAAHFLAFSYDEEGDSYDTQDQHLRERLDTEILSVLGGSLALARHEVDKALGWNLTQALDSAGVSEVRLFKSKDDRWTFTLDSKAA